MADFLNDFNAPSGGGNDFDFDAAAAAFPDISLDGGDMPIPTGPVAGIMSPSMDDPMAAFGAPSAEKVTNVRVTGGDEIDAFEEQFPDIGGAASPPPPMATGPTFGGTPTFAPRAQPPSFPVLSQPIQDEEEPEVIMAWREKQAEEIARRDAASKEKRQATIARAEQSIDKFYEEYNSKKERTIRSNKEEEADYVASLTDALGAGTTWARICSLIELENSQSKTLGRAGPNTTDLSRFKDILLRLKREGDAAPGAGGY